MFIRKERTGIRKKRNVPTGLYKIRAMNQDLVKEKCRNSLIFIFNIITLPNKVENRHLGIVAHFAKRVKGIKGHTIQMANRVSKPDIIAHLTHFVKGIIADTPLLGGLTGLEGVLHNRIRSACKGVRDPPGWGDTTRKGGSIANHAKRVKGSA